MDISRRRFLKTGAAGAALVPISTVPGLADHCGPMVFNVTAGQTINVGTVTVSNDNNFLYVKIDLINGWTFCDNTSPDESVKMWAGTDWSLAPLNSQGTPVPGQFPIKNGANGLSSWEVIDYRNNPDLVKGIPLANLSIQDVTTVCDQLLYILLHLDVCSPTGDHETAWGGNTPGTGTERWYFRAEYTICCHFDTDPPDVVTCQTAFARGNPLGSTGYQTYVWTKGGDSNPDGLPSLGLIKNRWGWAIKLKAHTTDTGIVLDLWAGAGLNDISKGEKVGTVTVTWDGSNATVTYELHSGCLLSETHLYARDKAPTKVAPGRYGYQHDFTPADQQTTDTVSVPLADTSADNGYNVWIIAHAVVCCP